ncbi:hypothetical protein GCM10027610_011030 [Dactylosporangium cerinum]
MSVVSCTSAQPRPRPVHDPGHEPRAEPLAPPVGADSDRLDERPLGAVPAQPRDVRHLQDRDHLTTVVGDDEQVARILGDRRERPLVRLVDHRVVPGLAEDVVRQQRDDGGQVVVDGFAELHNVIVVPCPPTFAALGCVAGSKGTEQIV